MAQTKAASMMNPFGFSQFEAGKTTPGPKA